MVLTLYECSNFRAINLLRTFQHLFWVRHLAFKSFKWVIYQTVTNLSLKKKWKQKQSLIQFWLGFDSLSLQFGILRNSFHSFDVVIYQYNCIYEKKVSNHSNYKQIYFGKIEWVSSMVSKNKYWRLKRTMTKKTYVMTFKSSREQFWNPNRHRFLLTKVNSVKKPSNVGRL